MRLPASFRDPDGWVFTRDGQLYRQIDRAYQPHYDRLMSSGLYEALVKDGDSVSIDDAIRNAVREYVRMRLEKAVSELK